MTYLLDTNVISEVRKRERCDRHVRRWWSQVHDSDLHLSVLVLGEIRKGVEGVRGNDPQQAEALEKWIRSVYSAFDGRILDIGSAVAEEWGRMNARRSFPIVDGLLAATAKVHSGARLLDPFVGKAEEIEEPDEEAEGRFPDGVS